MIIVVHNFKETDINERQHQKRNEYLQLPIND